MIISDNLRDKFRVWGRSAVLFSGGYDSEVLLRLAAEVLGIKDVISLTADTPLLAGFYRNHIQRVVKTLGIQSIFVEIDMLEVDEFTRNSEKRCYFCKKEMYRRLKEEAYNRGCRTVMDGTSTDDLNEHRPGLVAAGEAGIIHPFVEAGMGRIKISEFGYFLGALKHPSDSCLATRIPAGVRIESGLLALIEEMEAPLRPFVKGRFRVTILEDRLLVNYSSVDEKLIAENLNRMTKISDKSGYDIELRRQDS